MKILVTGGTGFIGLGLATHLSENGDNVTVCDNNFRGQYDEVVSKAIETYNLKFVKCDLTNVDELEKLDKDYDEIYHLAAINGTENFYKIPEKVLRVNILTTLNLLDWVVTLEKKPKILFSSSSESYAGTVDKKIPTPEDVTLSIDDVHNPRFSYAGSKIIGELLFVNYARQHDLDMRIVRYHNIYGPRMGFEHVMPQFSLRALRGENPFTVNGANNTRAFCFITDACEATKRVMRSKKAKNQVVNIGNDSEEIKISDLAKKILILSNSQADIELRDAPSGSTMRRCPDVQKLKALTGYESKTGLDEGLSELFLWYKLYFHLKGDPNK
tara:strand:+ start:663 stop:1646 length:984 start_codon:yes stop_codon:yes gene_type:complete